MQNLERAKIQLKLSALLKKLRMELVRQLLTSDTNTADAMTDALCEGLVRVAAAHPRKGKKAR